MTLEIHFSHVQSANFLVEQSTITTSLYAFTKQTQNRIIIKRIGSRDNLQTKDNVITRSCLGFFSPEKRVSKLNSEMLSRGYMKVNSLQVSTFPIDYFRRFFLALFSSL